jgi:hypothetical protein
MSLRSCRFALELFLIYFSSWLLISCSASSEGGFLSNELSSASCPAGGCANSQASAQGILLTSSVPGTATHATSGTNARFEFSGDCSPSTYAYNHIDVQIYSGCSGIGGSPRTNVSIVSILGADTFPQCVKGKYNLALASATLPLGAHTVVATLLAGNSPERTSHTFRNDTSGKIMFCYNRVN